MCTSTKTGLFTTLISLRQHKAGDEQEIKRIFRNFRASTNANEGQEKCFLCDDKKRKHDSGVVKE